MIARGQNLQDLKRQGLRLEAISGTTVNVPVRATDKPAEVGVVDVIFICVKAWDIEPSIESIRSMMGPKTAIVPLQNWIEAPEFLDNKLGRANVLGGICQSRSRLLSPGVVQAGEDTMKIIFGNLSSEGKVVCWALNQLTQKVTGVQIESRPDVKRRLWTKFIWVSSFGAVGSLSGASLGEWRQQSEMRRICKRLVQEACAVAKAGGLKIGWGISYRIARSMATGDYGYKTSMQLDLEAGRRSELPFQLGTIIKLGRAMGVSIDCSEEVYASLQASEIKNLGFHS